MELILKNTGATLTTTFSAGDADGPVTVTVTRADGTVLVTAAATTHGSTGAYSYVLAPQSELDQLTLVWSGTWGGSAQTITNHAEIVGDELFTVADARSFGDLTLADTSKYPDSAIRDARERITDMFEKVTEQSFIPRYQRDTLDGTGTSRLWLSKHRLRRLISVTVDGTALTAPQLALVSVYPSGHIDRDAIWPVTTRLNIVVSYEHGRPDPPADIQRAGLVLARYELVSSDITDRMISFSSDLGQFRLSVPGRDYPTGIPVVDATLARHMEAVPAGIGV